MTKLLVTLASVTSLLACTDDDPSRDDFVGSWAYQDGQFEIDCGNGQLMQFPLDGSLTETFSLGTATDLAKADNAGCSGITFEVDGGSAALAPTPQSCTIPNMGTSTATSYTFTLAADGQRLVSASAGTFTPQGAPGSCAFTGGGTLVRL